MVGSDSSLGVARLPHPRDRLGLDGVTLVVEHRDTAGYRSYSYWSPRADARDAHERAAAIMESIMRLRNPQDPRWACGRRIEADAGYLLVGVGCPALPSRS